MQVDEKNILISCLPTERHLVRPPKKGEKPKGHFEFADISRVFEPKNDKVSYKSYDFSGA
jgi:hypothetical protein